MQFKATNSGAEKSVLAIPGKTVFPSQNAPLYGHCNSTAIILYVVIAQ